MTYRRSIVALVIAFSLLLLSCSEEEKPLLRYRIACHVDDDGWVYSFDNQYLEGDEDYGSQSPNSFSFAFRGVNLRYRYNENYVTTIHKRDDKGNVIRDDNGNAIEVPALETIQILGRSKSQEERADRDTIGKYLGDDRSKKLYTTAELLALTPEDLNFTYVDPNLFLSLMKECLTSERYTDGKYGGIPSHALLTEQIYIDGYVFQVGLLGGIGTVEVILIDVLYKTGSGLTDYVQLYDLVRDGKASEEQVRLLDTIQEMEKGIVKNNDLQYKIEENGTKTIADVNLERLYKMLYNIGESEYTEYIPEYQPMPGYYEGHVTSPQPTSK